MGRFILGAITACFFMALLIFAVLVVGVVWIGSNVPRAPRTRTTQVEVAGDMVDGLPEAKRREIYRAIHAAGMTATDHAEARYPGSPFSGPVAEERKAYYDSEREKLRAEVAARFGIPVATMNAIDEEGDGKRWPLGNR